MSDQNQNTPKQSLDDSIEELVNEMGEATEKLKKQNEDAALSDEEFDVKAEIGSGVTAEEAAALAAQEDAPEPAGETLDEQIDGMLNDAESAAQESAAEPTSAIDAVNAELEGLTDEMLEGEFDDAEDVIEQGEVPEPAADVAAEPIESAEEPEAEVGVPEPEPTPVNAVDAVDAELAGLADEMLDGDFDDADDVIEQGVEPPAEAPVASEPEAEAEAPADDTSDAEEMLDGDFDDAEDVIEQGLEAEVGAKTTNPEMEAAPETEAETEDEPVAEVQDEPVSETEETQEPVAESNDEAQDVAEDDFPEDEAEEAASDAETKTTKKQKKAKKPKQAVEPKGDTKLPAFASIAAARAGDMAFTVAEKMNKPFDKKPEYMRDIAGWLAAVTLFNAAAAWFFLLFLRSPAVGTSTEPTVELVGGATTQQVEPEPIE